MAGQISWFSKLSDRQTPRIHDAMGRAARDLGNTSGHCSEAQCPLVIHDLHDMRVFAMTFRKPPNIETVFVIFCHQPFFEMSLQYSTITIALDMF